MIFYYFQQATCKIQAIFVFSPTRNDRNLLKVSKIAQIHQFEKSCRISLLRSYNMRQEMTCWLTGSDLCHNTSQKTPKDIYNLNLMLKHTAISLGYCCSILRISNWDKKLLKHTAVACQKHNFSNLDVFKWGIKHYFRQCRVHNLSKQKLHRRWNLKDHSDSDLLALGIWNIWAINGYTVTVYKTWNFHMCILETALYSHMYLFFMSFVWIGRKCGLNGWESGLVLSFLVLSSCPVLSLYVCMSVWMCDLRVMSSVWSSP